MGTTDLAPRNGVLVRDRDPLITPDGLSSEELDEEWAGRTDTEHKDTHRAASLPYGLADSESMAFSGLPATRPVGFDYRRR
jgi:hypothetical protein